MQAVQDVWLSRWSSDVAVWQRHPVVPFPDRFYISVYCDLGLASLAVGMISSLVLTFGSLNASQVRRRHHHAANS